MTVLLHPYMPETTAQAAGRARRSDGELALERARRFGARPGGAPRRQARRRCSRSRSDRLPHPPRPRAGARGRARRRGARGGRRRASSRSAWTRESLPRGARGRRAHERGLRRRRPPPQRRAPATTTRSPTSCASSRATRAAARSARPASTTTATTRRAPTRSARSPRRSSSRARPASRSSSTRARPRTTRSPRSPATRRALEVILHCFSMPDRLDECLEHGWWISFAGNVTYPKAHGPRRRGRARPARPPAGRDRRAVPDAAGGAQGAQPARLRRPHRALHRRAARHRLRGARGGRRGQRRAPVRLVSELPAQPSLRRLKAFGIRPEPRPRPELPDRLEPARRDRARGGARPGRRRARGRRRPRRAVRVPRRARRATSTSSRSTARSSRRCATRSTRTPNATLHFADAVKLDLARARPGADQGRRQPALRRRRDGDPAHGRGAARASTTLGRDGAEARSASGSRRRPGTAAYGAPSRARPARVRRARAAPGLAARCSIPVPNVDSVLVGLTAARPAPPSPSCARSCSTGFAHRRKALARSLALAPAAPATATRARAALEALGLPADARAETLAPEQWRDAARSARDDGCAACAPGQGQPLPVRRRAARGRAAPARLGRPAGLARRRADARARPASADEVVCPGVEGPNLAARALAAFREATGWDGPPQRLTIAQARAGRRRDGRRLRRRRRRAAARRRTPRARRRSAAAELAPRLGADVPRLLDARPRADDRRRRARRALCRPGPRSALVDRALRRTSSPRPTSTARPTASALRARRASWPRSRPTCGPATPAGRQRPPGRRPLAVPADRRRARRRRARPAPTHAMVSGSGPTVFGVFDEPGDARARGRTRLARPPAVAPPRLAAERGARATPVLGRRQVPVGDNAAARDDRQPEVTYLIVAAAGVVSGSSPGSRWCSCRPGPPTRALWERLAAIVLSALRAGRVRARRRGPRRRVFLWYFDQL